MADNKITLTKEDIQAIAQELKNAPELKSANVKNNTGAHAINKSAQNIQKLEGVKVNSKKHAQSVKHIKNVVNIGIILFWVIVLAIFLIKLAPYL